MKSNTLLVKTNKNLIAFIMAFGVFIWSFSAGIVTIALPTISQYLDISTSLVSWVVIAHLLVLTSFLLIFGKIGDYVGYKKVFLGGLFLFTVGSYFSGISLNIAQLILSRILQGIGSAMLLSMTPAIISIYISPYSTWKDFWIYFTGYHSSFVFRIRCWRIYNRIFRMALGFFHYSTSWNYCISYGISFFTG